MPFPPALRRGEAFPFPMPRHGRGAQGLQRHGSPPKPLPHRPASPADTAGVAPSPAAFPRLLPSRVFRRGVALQEKACRSVSGPFFLPQGQDSASLPRPARLPRASHGQGTVRFPPFLRQAGRYSAEGRLHGAAASPAPEAEKKPGTGKPRFPIPGRKAFLLPVAQAMPKSYAFSSSRAGSSMGASMKRTAPASSRTSLSRKPQVTERQSTPAFFAVITSTSESPT